MKCKKTQKTFDRKKENTKNHHISSAKRILNQFDEQRTFLLISVLHECYSADKDMTLVQFDKMVVEMFPSAHREHFLKIEAEYLKGE